MGEMMRDRGGSVSIFDPNCLRVCIPLVQPQRRPDRGTPLLAAACARHRGRGAWPALLGCDLRPEQIAANEPAHREIAACALWGVRRQHETSPMRPPADFVFSCPPYGDLEKY